MTTSRKNSAAQKTVIALAMAVLLHSSAQAALGFGPAVLALENVRPGVETEIPVPFEIHNETDKAATANLSVRVPADAGILKWEMGYAAVPSAEWFRLEKTQVEVGARSIAKVKLFVKIPDGAQYKNKKWVVGVCCEQGSAKVASGTGVGLMLSARLCLETIPDNAIDEKSAGIALAPSARGFTDCVPGETFEVKYTLRNNGAQPVTLVRKSLKELDADGERHPRYFMAGYEALFDSWTAVNAPIELGANETKEVTFSVTIPKTAAAGKSYEDVLFLTDGKGRTEFLRLRLKIAAK